MDEQENKTDRRVQRTRRHLRDALMELILERGYNAVTIAHLTERAELGRTTFYLHYRDKEDLLVESLEEIAEELKAQVELIADENVAEGGLPVNPVAVAFHHVQANRDLYRIILQGEGSNKAASRIRDIIEEAAADFFARRMSQFVTAPPELPRGLVAGYFAAALMGFVTLWLEKELALNGDEAAGLFTTLFFRGAAQVLNLTIEV